MCISAKIELKYKLAGMHLIFYGYSAKMQSKYELAERGVRI